MLLLVPKLARAAGIVALAALMLLFGYVVSESGYRNLGKWSTISGAFAGIALLWILSGPAMFAGGVWLLGSLGRRPVPFLLGGIAALLSGASLVGGVLTDVIPCSGPS